MIDRIYIAVLLLSVSGSVFCAVFLPLERLAYRLTSAKTVVFMNTAALVSFALPFYLVVAYYDGSESAFRDYAILVFRDAGFFENVVIALRERNVTKYLCGIWLSGAAWFFAYRMGRYLSFTRKTASGGFELNEGVWAETFGRLKRERGVRNVRLIGSCNVSTPCTFGLRNRHIAIPADMLDSFGEEEAELILRHEFYHVIHRDLLRKFLVMQIGCIHWFNPLFYLLKEKLSGWLEAACDDEVVKGFGTEERKRYVQLVVKVLELQRGGSRQGKWGVGIIGKDLESCQRRFERLLSTHGRTGAGGKALAVSVTLVSLFLGNAVAKEADAAVNKMFAKNVEIVSPGQLEKLRVVDIEAAQLLYPVGAGEGDFLQFRPYGAMGTAYGMLYGGTPAAFLPAHIYQFEDIALREHPKYPDGSCKRIYYEGAECPFCGTIRRGVEFGMNAESECPHKDGGCIKKTYQQVMDNGPAAGRNSVDGSVIYNKQQAVRQKLD